MPVPATHDAGPPDAVRRVIDLAALRANYRTLAALAAPARTGAVLKADAYGLGAAAVVSALAPEGCREVFVAHLSEALAIKPQTPNDITIHILNGLQPGEEHRCASAGYLPVLNSLEQAARWRDTARELGRPLPAVLQIDSGMSRLGLAAADVSTLAADAGFFEAVRLRLIMSHLACGDEPDAQSNRDQRDTFLRLAALLPPTPLSLANSGGVFLGGDFGFDLVRPGLALYGVAPAGADIRPVVSLDARIVQVRDVPAGQGVGYGLDFTTARASRIATVSIGYADGWPRSLGDVGRAFVGAMAVPIVGRVSMDSLTLDVTDLPRSALALGDYVEFIGPHQTLQSVAVMAKTIPYDILTGLGRRHAPTYRDTVGVAT